MKNTFTELLAKAKAGDSKAMVDIGNAYYDGKGVTQDPAQAISWWEKAVKLGDPKAMLNLGIAYREGKGIEKNIEKAIDLWTNASKCGDPMAMFNLGLAHSKGEGVDKDASKAITFWTQAADQDSPVAMINLGFAYIKGENVRKDTTKAISYWTKAANLDSLQAMVNLGLVYIKGELVEKDSPKAIALWEKAAVRNYPQAMFNLGVAYNIGDGVEKDRSKAISLWIKAAEMGDPRSMFNLGIVYSNGDGVERDDTKAIALWEKAAALKYPKAMFNLGVAYNKGDGVKKEITKAISWWTKASELDDLEATLNLGFAYSGDDEVLRNIDLATKYYTKAKSLGSDIADMHLFIIRCERKLSTCGIRQNEVNLLVAIMRELSMDVNSIKKDHIVDTGNPGTACHFTSTNTLRSMLSDQDLDILRMYNVGYFNDPTEGMSLWEYAKNKHHPLGGIYEASDFDIYKRLHFAAAFTSRKDRLDLWRAYGKDGNGICIAIPFGIFPATSLQYSPIGAAILNPESEPDTSSTQDRISALTLYRVHYVDSDKQKALDLIRPSLDKLSKTIDALPVKSQQKEAWKCAKIILADLLYLYKNEEYRTEGELRILSFHAIDDDIKRLDNATPEYDARREYIDTGPFLFHGESCEIIIGPKVANSYAVQVEIEHLLRKRGYTKVTVKQSDVRYR